MPGVFRAPAKPHFRISKMALDHAERMFDLLRALGFRVLDFAMHSNDPTSLIKLFAAARTYNNRPDNLTILMLVHAGATHITADPACLNMFYAQNGHLRKSRTNPFAFWIIRLCQKTLFIGLPTFTSVLGVSEGHLLHRVSLRLRSNTLPNLGRR
ncbi:hypothetical protein AMC94_26495 [Pseudomonas amygdali pv. aesculi]|nr:hypothetical protein AL041_15725 [Pseudomonas amygdali pv. aesculi]KWT21239.1 hypothetical protein AL043_26615 [Pseudomonas amygdali pv. aesculi]KWT24678.1 hypothetical protein AL044_23120 [Pseudomonas amygdali pv. aesculi]KWT36044.1 hypothetical protein AMC94_26495 [Pseudomonas amygdali pv. aesculi]RMP56489.1 hypothetical protein ALQ22_200039 [Pseudomonas savastanoi pv. retacarpa]